MTDTAVMNSKKSSMRKALAKSQRAGPRTERVSRGIRATNAPRRFIQTCLPSSTNFTAGSAMTYGASNGQMVGPGATATDGTFSLQFSLSDLPQASSFQTIFDAYKIEKVEVKFIPDGNVLPEATNMGAASTAVAKAQFLNTAVDFDDANQPGSLAAVLEYETFQVSPPYREHRVVLKPRVAREIFDGAVTTAYEQPDEDVWLDIAQMGIPHYGLKGYVQSAGATNNIQAAWRVYVTYHIACKQIR